MQILGTGSALPEKIVTNIDIAKIVDTDDEWIKDRTGIAQRHISTGDTVASLAAKACERALDNAGKKAEDVELIILASCSPEIMIPCVACQVQDKIGAVNAGIDYYIIDKEHSIQDLFNMINTKKKTKQLYKILDKNYI